MSKRQTVESFWDRVDVKSLNECWEYTGKNRNQFGHKRLNYRGHVYMAHRLAAWFLGLINSPRAPANKKKYGLVLHECDNPPCCNPIHLKIGTQKENITDMVFRNRTNVYKGQEHCRSVLRNSEAIHIRKKYKTGISQRTLAKEYGVSSHTIHRITSGISYQCN